MIADIKPYPEYRESGLPWLGKVPKHWNVVRNSSVFGQRNETGFADLPILEVSLKTGVRVRNFETSKRKQIMSDIGKYKRAAKGDVAYNMMRMWQGAVGISPVDGLVSPAYIVARPYPNVVPKYFVEMFRTAAYMAEVDNFSRGIVKDRNRLYWDEFKQMLSPRPPSAEQAAIVRFLDWANGRLDRAIRAKRKVIVLLNEQKRAIIHRAVTRGLDPSVPLRPSGIPWLGDIPQHWEVRPIKHWAKINSRTLGQSTDGNFEFRYIDIGAVRTGYLVQEPELVRFAKAPSRARRVLVAGDTIISTVRTYLKAVWFVSQDAKNLIASTGFAVFSPNPELEPEYLHYVVQDSSFVNQVTANSIGIAYPAIAETVLARFRVAIPASRNEQRDLIVAIKKQNQPLSAAISHLEHEIELLREYRTRLVADVVTGKLDVREAATRLPEETTHKDIAEVDDVELIDEVELSGEVAA